MGEYKQVREAYDKLLALRDIFDCWLRNACEAERPGRMARRR